MTMHVSSMHGILFECQITRYVRYLCSESFLPSYFQIFISWKVFLFKYFKCSGINKLQPKLTKLEPN